MRQPFVDANRIGSLGICAGGSYALGNLYREGYDDYMTTHIDMYDKPQYVTPAVAKLKEFFGKAFK